MSESYTEDGHLPDTLARRKRPSRAFVKYLIAICFGIAATLAFQSYGEAAKQLIATKAPQLAWSPQSRQMIASWVSELGWTKPSPAAPEGTAGQPAAPQSAPVAQPAQAMAPAPVPAAPSIDPQQIQQIVRNLAEVRGVVEQLATSQNIISRDIANLQTANQEILEKISAPAPRPGSTQGRVHAPVPRPSAAAPMPLH
jgi:hypothetical protein